MASRNATAIAWAWAAAPELGKGPWGVLMVLAKRVNNRREDFDVWPGQERIAIDIGLSVPTVKRYLKVLEDGNWLSRRSRISPGRGMVGKVYTLNVVANYSMPNGKTVKVDFYGEDGESPQLNQGGPTAHSVHSPQLTADLSIKEPYNRELKKEEESPLPPSGAAGTGDTDLFGKAVIDPETAFEEAIVERFAAGWNELAERYQAISNVSTMAPRRKSALLARVREWYSGLSIEDGVAVVNLLLARIDGSPFLCGQVKDWAIKVDWVLGPENFTKTMERRDERKLGSNENGPTGAGASSVRAGARALEILRASRNRPRSGGDGAAGDRS